MLIWSLMGKKIRDIRLVYFIKWVIRAQLQSRASFVGRLKVASKQLNLFVQLYLYFLISKLLPLIKEYLSIKGW